MASSSSTEDSLVNAVNKIEEKFKSTEKELTNMEKKMEVEFSSVFEGDDALDNGLRNPVKVLQRINEIKTDFAQIKQEVADIQKEQSEALQQVKGEFDKLLSSLSSLEHKVLEPDACGSGEDEREQKLLSLLDHMAKKSTSIVTDNPPSTSTS